MNGTPAVNPAARTDGLVIPEVTLPEFVLGQAHMRGGKPALIEAGSGRQLSYAQLAAAVRQAGAWLAARGVRARDVLALCAPNSIEFVVTWYAASSIGATVATVNPLSPGGEILRQLSRTGARWLVTTAGLLAAELEAAGRPPGVAETFVIGAGFKAAPGTRRFDVLGPGGEAEAPKADLSPSDAASLLSSSGTTGLPKHVVHGASPDQAARLLLHLARGHGDRLSGRHLTVADDLDALLAQLDQITRHDLHTLRLRTAAAS